MLLAVPVDAGEEPRLQRHAEPRRVDVVPPIDAHPEREAAPLGVHRGSHSGVRLVVPHRRDGHLHLTRPAPKMATHQWI